MAVYLNNGVSCVLNSVDLSDHLTAITINQTFDELEITAMADNSHKFVKGLEASTITLDFLNDLQITPTNSVNAVLRAAYGTTVPIVIKQQSGAVSTTNPSYSTTVLINNLNQINGAVGDISSQSLTLTCNSVITVATS